MSLKFAVVDCEATGGKKELNRVIEIGIVLTDGYTIEKTYQTLIDPGQKISPFIEHLTGIKNEDVEKAPPFGAVAEEIFQMLDGRIFVAHNVSFDYALLFSELKRALCSLNAPRLCTLKISRKIFPGLSRYKLDTVSEFLEYKNFERHRALGDALAAAHILKKALEKAGEAAVQKMIVKKN